MIIKLQKYSKELWQLFETNLKAESQLHQNLKQEIWRVKGYVKSNTKIPGSNTGSEQ